ncbi:MAG: HAD-IIB family hydrolase [bacterium]|nr:HAD-IIB family hydrolase [bacterium]
MEGRLLLATDLDRTLLPNGEPAESPDARRRFARVAARDEVVLAYVTGRHRALVEEAIERYGLPEPAFVIGDVGTSIYGVAAGRWRRLTDWEEPFADRWAGRGTADLAAALAAVSDLFPQPAQRQGRWKLSFFAPELSDPSAMLAEVRARLDGLGVQARLVWSLDDEACVGLLDVLPLDAGKSAAIGYLLRTLGLPIDRAVYAGDSGNDLDVLAGPVPAILVANARVEVRHHAVAAARIQGHADRLYLARGDWQGMNGNYSAGILEGLAHYLPESVAWWTDGRAGDGMAPQ